MNQIVSFKLEDQEFPMEITDQNGERWIPSQQVGEALGTKNIRDLIRGLKENSELAEGKHICRLTLQMPGDTQPRKYSVLSYRGVIRVAMRSEGRNAVAFRDWAEDVLYEVMVHGFYQSQDHTKRMRQRRLAIQEEIRSFKEDEKLKKLSETEARNIRYGRKTLDDLAGYPKLREAVEILENSECREHENYAVLFFQAVWRLWQTCGEKTAAFFDLREDDREAWIHMPDALRAVRNGKGIREVLRAGKNRFYDDLKNHPAYIRDTSHRFRGKKRKGWCFDTDKIRIQ